MDKDSLLSYQWENWELLLYQVIAFRIQFLHWKSIFTKERKVVWEIWKGFGEFSPIFTCPSFLPLFVSFLDRGNL